jgi:hypothetical protein
LVHLLVFHAYIKEMHGSRSKISSVILSFIGTYCAYFTIKHCKNLSFIAQPFFPSEKIAPGGLGHPHYRRFTVIFRRTTLNRILLDEWSARCTVPYLTKHNIHTDKHTCPRATVSTSKRPQIHTDRAATGIGKGKVIPMEPWIGSKFSRWLRLPTFLDERYVKVESLSTLHTDRLYPPSRYPSY